MTDLEKFIEIYKSFGINCIVGEKDMQKVIEFHGSTGWVEPTWSDKFEGYSGFYSQIIFSLDGKFIKQTFYE